MNWVTWVFLFAIYAIIVKIIVWVYEKLTKNKDKSKDSFDLKTHNELNGKSFSIVVENDYTLQAELTSKMLLLIFFIFIMSTSLSHEMDAFDELYRRMALWTAMFGFGFTLLTRNKMLLTLVKNKLYIREDLEHIAYDYVTEKGELKTDVILKNQIQSIKWSYFPYASKDTAIWMTEMDKDGKDWGLVFTPFYLVVTVLHFLLFMILKKFQLNKYVLYRTEAGIIAIPIDVYQHLLPITFEWRSIVNRYIINGGTYDK